MKTNFLLITNSHEQTWLPVMKEALAPLGKLHTETEAAAVDRLRRLRDCVVIIDANRTKDAPGLLSQIRRQFRDLKVAIITTSPDWREARQMFKLGAVDYIYRPMAVNELRMRFQPPQSAVSRTAAKPVKK